MKALSLTLSRSPRSLRVVDDAIDAAGVRTDVADVSPEGNLSGEFDCSAEDRSGSEKKLSPSGESGSELPASPVHRPPAEVSRTAGSERRLSGQPVSPGPALPASVASVITDVADRVVTPLAQSNSVPLLSGATHEVVTAGEIGFGGIPEEELIAVRQMIGNISEQVQELKIQQHQSLHELQEVAVALATSAASWLVGYAIDRGHFAVDDLIRTALMELEPDQGVRVHLNPADHEILKSLMENAENRRDLEDIQIIDNPQLSRGSCRVESGRRILVTDMNERLDDIRRLWMEKLDDSQVERRGNGSTSGTMRRFPERRETA